MRRATGEWKGLLPAMVSGPFYVPSDRNSMVRSVALLDKFAHPTTGQKSEWYVGFVQYRAYLTVSLVVHTPEEEKESLKEIHIGADMSYALKQGWIEGYHIIKTKHRYPYMIKTIRLLIPEGVDRSVWKRLLGNRGYDNLHLMMHRWKLRSTESYCRQPSRPLRDNTYYGKDFHPNRTKPSPAPIPAECLES